MRFPFKPVHTMEDVTRNFEQIEQQGLYTGTGVPTFQAQKGDYYFRRDDVAVANHRVYVCSGGSTWTGIV